MTDNNVIKYNLGDPSVPFTSTTSEFHEACLQRGILTKEQTIVAKGATLEQARRILEEENIATNQERTKVLSTTSELNGNLRDVDESDQDDEDDLILEDDPDYQAAIRKYRQSRLQDLESSKDKRRVFGDVQTISRVDWTREVNDASRGGTDMDPCWVVICLTGGLSEECSLTERAVYELSIKFIHVKFICIQSTAAIENWPSKNLPTLFLYFDGKCRHQLVGLESVGGPGMNALRLEWILAHLSVDDDSIPPVIKTDLADEPNRSPHHEISSMNTITKLGNLAQSLARSSIDDV